MTPEQRQRVEHWFDRLADGSIDEARSMLGRDCDDVQVRDEVIRLLSGARSAGTVTATPSAIGLHTHLTELTGALKLIQPGSQIGPYTIVAPLGGGGMGDVYKAEQTHPIRRTVAIKVIKLGFDTRQVIARFESERQALARMDHPNVARVIDAGATDAGRPYFVMEYVPGVPITRFADENRLSIKDRLLLFTQACHAIAHAHTKAILHRDIKAPNVLAFMDDDGKPTVKVIDFGIAKAMTGDRLTDLTLDTGHGQIIGTFDSMSPEQAEGSPDIDTRTDVYSLGVLLYELLTGSKPFDQQTISRANNDELRRLLREVDPPRPSTRLSMLGESATVVAEARRARIEHLERELRSELEWIPMKAMRKEPERRYATPLQLAEDIQNYLAGRPLIAGPESRAYRARKFVTRNWRGVAVASVMLALLVAGIITTTWQARVAKKQRDVAQLERDNAQAVLQFFTEDVLASANPEQTRGREVTVKEAVDKAAEGIGKAFADRPLVEASVRVSLSETYRSLGQYERAYEHAQRAYELRRERLGEDNWDTVVALNHAAAALVVMGKTREAEPLVQQVFDRTRAIWGPDHLESLGTQQMLAVIKGQLGRNDEAEMLLRERYELIRNRFGDEDADTLYAQANYGAVLVRTQKLELAEQMIRTAIDKGTKSLGADSPDVLDWRNSLIFLFEDQARYDDAEPLAKQVLETRRRVLGETHPDTLSSQNVYAYVLLKLGHFNEALELFRNAVAARLAKSGPEGPDTLRTQDLYASALETTGRLEEAAKLYREVLEVRRRVQGPEHPDTLGSVNLVACILQKMGRSEDAEPFGREAVAKMPGVLGEHNRKTLMAKNNYAAVLHSLKRDEEADALSAFALDGLKRTLGPKHPDTKLVARTRAVVLDALGRREESVAVRTEFGLASSTTRSSTTQSGADL